MKAEASFRGAGGPSPPPPKEKEIKKKKKEKRKKRKKGEKREKGKKGTMNNVKLLHMKCFFQFFNSPVALKNKKHFWPPQEKVEMTPLHESHIPLPFHKGPQMS